MKVIAYTAAVDGETWHLVYDTDDVESFQTPRDVHELPSDGPGVRRAVGKAHLILNFREGTQPTWERADAPQAIDVTGAP